MKIGMGFLWRLLLLVVGALTGASGGVLMAAASDLPDAGKTNAGAEGDGGSDPTAGIATETQGRADGDPNFYMADVDKRIVKIRPMASPIDQISRYAKSSSCDSFEVKYYSVGTREIKCMTTDAVTAMSSGASTKLPVSAPNMFTLDDTIRVVGVKGVTNPETGQAYEKDDPNTPDLVLCVRKGRYYQYADGVCRERGDGLVEQAADMGSSNSEEHGIGAYGQSVRRAGRADRTLQQHPDARDAVLPELHDTD